jgi:repressor LexA
MMKGLTDKQEQVLQAIREFQQLNGYPPTVRELADLFGQSSSAGMHKILMILQEKGYLHKGGRGKSRSLFLVEENEQSAMRVNSYPVLGQVEAGMPQLAFEDHEEELWLDSDWIGGGGSFILKVHGHSMIDADIRDGDLLVVQKTDSCHNGDIVIALLEDEATVKRFFKEKERIRLQPENPTMQAIYIQKNDPSFRIIGKVQGLLRKY